MYNAELKTEFITQYTTSISMRKVCVAMFNGIEPYEIEWGADVCTRSAEELKEPINKVLGLRSNSHKARMTVFRAYATWCIENKVENACDGLLRVEVDSLNTIKSCMVNSPLHLQSILDFIYDKESMNTIDNTYRCFYWLGFSGVPEEYVCDIKANNIVFEEMVIRVAGVDYPLYTESLKAFKKCATSEGFAYFHPNYSDEIYRLRVDGQQLLRGVKAEATLGGLKNMVSRRQREARRDGIIDTKLSYGRTLLSGLFYRKYQLELIGVEPDFIDVADNFIGDKEYKLDKSKSTIGSVRSIIARNYKRDYESWKEAFFAK